MDPNNFIHSIRNLIFFIGQVIVLVLCVIFINYMYVENILPDKQVAEEYTVSSCNVVAKELQTRGRIIHRYRAYFLLDYLANGQTIRAPASGNGLDHAYTTNEAAEQESLDQFTVGSSYPCWYDPTNPQVVVLVQRHNWSSTFPLIVPSVIALMMMFYLFRTIFQWFESIVANRRK